MIELYIRGRKADLSSGETIVLTYSQSDADMPTAERNSFSKTVTLQGTPNNNSIFEEIYRLDRTSYDFDARKRVDAVIYNNSDVVEQGYISLDDIVRKGTEVSYEITFYGGKGNFFYNLMYDAEDDGEITLADLYYGFTDEDGNVLTTEEEREKTLVRWNKEYVKGAWDKLALPFDRRDMSPDNWIVPAPVYGGYYDDFDSDKILVNRAWMDDASKRYFPDSIGDAVPKNEWALVTAGRELDEWESRDLRSQYQRPAVKMELILDAISKPENNGGYEVVWDDEIKESDYYRKSYMILDRINFDYGNDIADMYWQTPSRIVISNLTGITYTDGVPETSKGGAISFSGKANPHVELFVQPNVITEEATTYDNLYTCQKYTEGAHLNEYNYSAFWYRLDAYSGNTVIASSPNYFLATDAIDGTRFGETMDDWREAFATQYDIDADSIKLVRDSIVKTSNGFIFSNPLDISLALPANADNVTFRLVTSTVGMFDTGASHYFVLYYNNRRGDFFTVKDAHVEGNLISDEDRESGWYDGLVSPSLQKQNVTKDTLFRELATPYDFLIGFAKIFGMKFRMDDGARKIYVQLRKNYYIDSLVDMDERIDRGSDISLKPCIAESKWMLFGLPVPDTYAQYLYDVKNKVQYGKYRLNTQYNFNSETNDLYADNVYRSVIPYRLGSVYFNAIAGVPSIVLSPTYEYTLFTDEGEESKVRYGYAADTSIGKTYDDLPKLCCFDSDNGNVDDATCMLAFFNGIYQSDNVYSITDNIYAMTEINGNACYIYTESESGHTRTDSDEYSRIAYLTNQIPMFGKCLVDDAREKYTLSFDFSKPTSTFTNDRYFYGSEICIYDRFWKDYTEDMYDRNGKSVTLKCFLPFKPAEAMRYFYWFDNGIWVLSNISDYDVEGNKLTQCTFIKVKNKENYLI